MDTREELYDIVKPFIKMHNDAVTCSWRLYHYLRSKSVAQKNKKVGKE